MDEMTLTFNNPITEEQWDIIEDVDFENTNRIWFHTKNGKDVAFIKRKKGEWLNHLGLPLNNFCSVCAQDSPCNKHWDFCPNCGADMRN